MKKTKKIIICTLGVIIFFQLSMCVNIAYADSYKYDALNRVIEMHCSSGEIIYYTYDAAGNIIIVKHNMPDLDSISLNKNDVLMKVSDTFNIIVTANSKDGKKTDITKYAEYSSSDASVSSVSKDGKITAEKIGNAAVKVNYYDKTAVLNVKVVNNVEYIWDSIINFFKDLFNPIIHFFNP